MKKIFAFIGSPLKKKSNTYTVTKMALDYLCGKDPQIAYEIFTAGDVQVNYCRGCWLCMTKGYCPQDEKDDMKMLKEKMKSADFIIWGSPVYTMTVTGQMKTFMDRLAAWYHTIALAGKPGMTVTTTAGGGVKEVRELITMLLGVMGVKVIANLDAIGYFPQTLGDPETAKKKAEEIADTVYPYVIGEKLVESDEYMEECFQFMRNKSVFAKEWLPGDYKHWESQGMLEVNSYKELLEKMRGE